MKMYITQLRGVFEQISQENEEQLEEAGRRLAQSIASDGQIIIHGFGSISHIIREAVESPNALPKTITVKSSEAFLKQSLNSNDTLLLVIPNEKSDEAIEFLKSLNNSDVQVVGILTKNGQIPGELNNYLDTSLFVPQSGPLIPFNDAEKIGTPDSLAELFLYHLIYFSVMEILDEQDLLDTTE